VHRKVEFPAFNPFKAGVFNHLLRVVGAVVATTAGGENARQGGQSREQSENSDTAQETKLLVIGEQDRPGF
jgi:hypothetical protein